jgi:hypothetical protein
MNSPNPDPLPPSLRRHCRHERLAEPFDLFLSACRAPLLLMAYSGAKPSLTNNSVQVGQMVTVIFLH